MGSHSSDDQLDVIIVGAGVAGLAAAHDCLEAGLSVKVFEASGNAGGRVMSIQKDGFILDKGFQVLLTAYPEAQQRLDYKALNLKPFKSGAKIRVGNVWHTLADPWRHPQYLLHGAIAPVGSVLDKIKVAGLRNRLLSTTLNTIFSSEETTTQRYLEAYEGFSDGMIDRFFRPFYGGVFLDRQLGVSSRMFEFTYKMFATGHAALPEGGMASIPRQMARPLVEQGIIEFHSSVTHVSKQSVTLADGSDHYAKAVIVAIPRWQRDQLLKPDGLGDYQSGGSASPAKKTLGTTCLYFNAKKPFKDDGWLYLNGNLSAKASGSVINSVCFPTSLQPSYSKSGEQLVSVTLLGTHRNEHLPSEILAQLKDWFGDVTAQWYWLHTDVIENALPLFTPPTSLANESLHPSGVFLCGDGDNTPSLNGAMVSARKTVFDCRHYLSTEYLG